MHVGMFVGRDGSHPVASGTYCFKEMVRTSLVVQRLGICLPVQGTQVQSLVWEDATFVRQLLSPHAKTTGRPSACSTQQEKPL